MLHFTFPIWWRRWARTMKNYWTSCRLWWKASARIYDRKGESRSDVCGARAGRFARILRGGLLLAVDADSAGMARHAGDTERAYCALVQFALRVADVLVRRFRRYRRVFHLSFVLV